MKKLSIVLSLAVLASLSACEKQITTPAPTVVVTPAAPTPDPVTTTTTVAVPVAVPGPTVYVPVAGPKGEKGDTGNVNIESVKKTNIEENTTDGTKTETTTIVTDSK